MAAPNILKASTEEAFNTTLDGALAAGATSVDLTSVTGLQSPCVLVIDRQDSAGTDTPTKREYVYVSAINTNTLTIERGQGGSSDQAHNDGALIEEVMTASLHWEGLRTCVAAGHTDAGTGIHLTGTASIAIVQAQKALVSTISAGAITTELLKVTNLNSGIKGQFVWTQAGALATSLATLATHDHLPFLRARKNLTINSIWAGLNSCPSLGAFQANMSYRSAPTAAHTTVLSTALTIDVGEYTTDTAATPAVLGITSLASGTLLSPSIDAPRECGDLTLTLNCTERE